MRESADVTSPVSQGAVLAFMRADPRDIRPDLLLYAIERDQERFPKLFCYGCAYLSIRFAKAGLQVPEDAIQLAVVDALSILQTRKAPYTLKERAQELRLRAHVFGALRKAAVRLFELRYQEALVRYQAAVCDDEDAHDKSRVRIEDPSGIHSCK